MKRPSLDKSINVKLSAEHFEAVEARAFSQSLNRGEYVRHVLITAPRLEEISQRVELLSTIQIEELQALRTIMINFLGALASGKPLTMEWIEALRAHADEIKATKAQNLLRASTTTKPQTVEQNKEAI